MVLDTKFFGQEFKDRLLASFENLEEQTNGLLIHSENFQALNLLQERYREQVDCIYLDPPYNTDASPIAYKNGYKSSSWVSLVDGRLSFCRDLLKNDGVLAAAIDDTQQKELSFLLSSWFDEEILGTVALRSNPSGRPTKAGFSVSHEYVIFAGRSTSSSIGRMPPTDEQMARFSQKDDEGSFEWRNLRREGSNSDRQARRFLYYPIFITRNSLRIPNMGWNEDKGEWIIKEKPKDEEKIVYPNDEAGNEKTWRWSHEKVNQSMNQIAVRKDRSGKDYVYYKRRPHEEGVVSVTSWFDAKYSATEHGTAVLKALFEKSPFTYPKSIYAVSDSIYVAGASQGNAIVLDPFGGSATTAHAVISLNRKDKGKRKYILVEVGEYFDEVTKLRVQKVIYSKDWKDGKPVSREGSSHLFKYIRLETYEDTLNNLELKRTEEQASLLEAHDEFREDYMLRYMLDVEAYGSTSILNIEKFADPFNYQLNVATGASVGETRPITVDLVETFNYLLGLRIKNIDTISGFRVVEGTNPEGEKALVIWRNTREKSNDDLDQFFQKQRYNTRDSKFDLIYTNGDNNLENLKRADETWKVRLIEEEFKRLMFDVQDV